MSVWHFAARFPDTFLTLRAHTVSEILMREAVTAARSARDGEETRPV
jgi:hypothetical protein